jgi:hypothetical protein
MTNGATVVLISDDKPERRYCDYHGLLALALPGPRCGRQDGGGAAWLK